MAAVVIGNASTFSARSPLKEWNGVDEEAFSIRSRVLTPSSNRKTVVRSDTATENVQISKLQEGLQSVTHSLSLLSDTIGGALAESFSLFECEQGLSNSTSSPSQSQSSDQTSDQSSDCTTYSPSQNPPLSSSAGTEESPMFQLKPSRDLAMAMTTKAKLLLRELKTVRAELSFMRNRTAQLEEENKRMRGSMSKGSAPEEDDLVRRQLETLLAEKARLVQENATYKRENQFLHEAIEYHQLRVQGMVLPE